MRCLRRRSILASAVLAWGLVAAVVACNSADDDDGSTVDADDGGKAAGRDATTGTSVATGAADATSGGDAPASATGEGDDGGELVPGDSGADADAGPLRWCPAARTADDAGWLVVPGFDVSEYEYVDWDAAAAASAGYKYAFVRATAGATLLDTQFVRDWKEMKRVGLARGAYDYFHVELAAADQVDAFLQALKYVGGLTDSDFPPVIDIEDTAGMPTGTIECRAKTWLARVEAATGRIPVLYTNFLFADVFDESFARYTLWESNFVKDPTVTCPHVMPSWPSWTLWQWTSSATVPGVYENADPNGAGSIATTGGKPVLAPTDLDDFNGSPAALSVFLAGTISPSPPPDPAPPASPPVVAADAGTDCSDGCCVLGD